MKLQKLKRSLMLVCEYLDHPLYFPYMKDTHYAAFCPCAAKGIKDKSNYVKDGFWVTIWFEVAERMIKEC